MSVLGTPVARRDLLTATLRTSVAPRVGPRVRVWFRPRRACPALVLAGGLCAVSMAIAHCTQPGGYVRRREPCVRCGRCAGWQCVGCAACVDCAGCIGCRGRDDCRGRRRGCGSHLVRAGCIDIGGRGRRECRRVLEAGRLPMKMGLQLLVQALVQARVRALVLVTLAVGSS